MEAEMVKSVRAGRLPISGLDPDNARAQYVYSYLSAEAARYVHSIEAAYHRRARASASQPAPVLDVTTPSPPPACTGPPPEPVWRTVLESPSTEEVSYVEYFVLALRAAGLEDDMNDFEESNVRAQTVYDEWVKTHPRMPAASASAQAEKSTSTPRTSSSLTKTVSKSGPSSSRTVKTATQKKAEIPGNTIIDLELSDSSDEVAVRSVYAQPSPDKGAKVLPKKPAKLRQTMLVLVPPKPSTKQPPTTSREAAQSAPMDIVDDFPAGPTPFESNEEPMDSPPTPPSPRRLNADKKGKGKATSQQKAPPPPKPRGALPPPKRTTDKKVQDVPEASTVSAKKARFHSSSSESDNQGASSSSSVGRPQRPPPKPTSSKPTAKSGKAPSQSKVYNPDQRAGEGEEEDEEAEIVGNGGDDPDDDDYQEDSDDEDDDDDD